jgi:transposase
LWIRDPAEIKAKRLKKERKDRRDAQLLLGLMREDNIPQVWYPVRRTGICDNCCGTAVAGIDAHEDYESTVQALAMNEGYRWKKKLFSEQGQAQLEKYDARGNLCGKTQTGQQP